MQLSSRELTNRLLHKATRLVVLRWRLQENLLSDYGPSLPWTVSPEKRRSRQLVVPRRLGKAYPAEADMSPSIRLWPMQPERLG